MGFKLKNAFFSTICSIFISDLTIRFERKVTEMAEIENNAPDISPELAASLFAPEEETESIKPEQNKAPVPEPAAPADETEEETPEVTPDLILKYLTETDENGHSQAVIVASLERLHNVTEGKLLEDIPEDDREYVDDMVIEGAAIDIYSLDGQLYNLILKFDTVKDAYLKEINEMCNRYRDMQESMSINDVPNTELAYMSITLMPNQLQGYGALSLSFPIGYFRVLDDNGVNASMLLQFTNENVQFQALEMDSETRSELVADVMREMEEGKDGQIYE